MVVLTGNCPKQLQSPCMKESLRGTPECRCSHCRWHPGAGSPHHCVHVIHFLPAVPVCKTATPACKKATTDLCRATRPASGW